MEQVFGSSQIILGRETSPEKQSGFNNDALKPDYISGNPDCSSGNPDLVEGKDIINIVTKRRLGGDGCDESTQVHCKKARLDFSVDIKKEADVGQVDASLVNRPGMEQDLSEERTFDLDLKQADTESGVLESERKVDKNPEEVIICEGKEQPKEEDANFGSGSSYIGDDEVQQKTKKADDMDQDGDSGCDIGANSFKEINLSLDILNGVGTSSFSVDVTETQTDIKESHVEIKCELKHEDDGIKCDKMSGEELLLEIKSENCEHVDLNVNDMNELGDNKSEDIVGSLSSEDKDIPTVKEENASTSCAGKQNLDNTMDSVEETDRSISGCETESKYNNVKVEKSETTIDKKEAFLDSKGQIVNDVKLPDLETVQNDGMKLPTVHHLAIPFISPPFNSDLDILASAAERRSFNRTDVKIEETVVRVKENNKNECDSSMEKDGKDKRKSRKQNAPRRIPYAFTATTGEKFDEENTDQLDKLEEIQHMEKSRKQNKPQRIPTDLSDYDDNSKLGSSDVSKEFFSGTSESGIDESDSADENYYSEQLSEKHAQSNGSGVDFSSYRNLFATAPGRNIREPGFPVSALQNEMLATLSQSLYQSPTVNDDGKTNIDNPESEDNIGVVRRLREIRFYKYRKISLAEKQEIAAYAKLHGVSSAAAHFGVSKSAVSMWTRTNFSDIKSDPSKRKRNCMVGNEKFEQLLERVKNEKINKFKGLSKQDKFEVSRYAKLVGVREMARCLGIALGTVSGWMRQFPYNLKTGGNMDDMSDYSFNSCLDLSGNPMIEIVNDEESLDGSTNQETLEGSVNQGNCSSPELHSHPKSEVTASGSVSHKEGKNDKSEESSHSKPPSWDDDEDVTSQDSTKTVEFDKGYAGEMAEFADESNASTYDKSPDDAQEKIDHSDEVDEMIAETFLAPDIDQCFEDIQDKIQGTPLENDEFFESLFRRVLSCRVAKYKTLLPSEKLEVVRYAKRNGVRRIAKLLGLATGTLSGWTTKYQSLLGLTMDGVPEYSSSQDGTASTSNAPSCSSPTCSSPVAEGFYTPDCQGIPATSIAAPTSSSILDNPEKSEVTAIKLLLKEQFPVLLRKIEIARRVKFRNITPEEKIEIVKCAKLVGIRPTARVLSMPIGTLSGWITKYSNNLHPVYHVENVENPDGTQTTADQIQKTDSNAFRNELYAKNLSLMNSPAPHSFLPAFNLPGHMVNPAAFGLLSTMHNSFSSNFLNTGLNTSAVLTEDKTGISEGSRLARSSENMMLGSNKAFDGQRAAEVGAGVGFNFAPGFSAMGNVDIEAETKRIADHYVRLFNEAKSTKFK